MRKILLLIILIVILTGATWFGLFVWKNWQGIKPVITAPSEDITTKIKDQTPDFKENTTGMPLSLPDGFSISVFAKDLDGARVMRFDKNGNMWVSRTNQGVVSLLIIRDDKVTHQSDSFRNLNKPHGLIFDPDEPLLLYIAEEDSISKVYTYTEMGPEKIIDLPAEGGGHFTRTLGIGHDKRLYVSIGSSCNVCKEKDSRRAAIYSVNTDGSDFKPYAAGLRNAVFFTWGPFDNKIWATEMGRDWLGDDLPPDEINIVEQGKDYGWPYCYGKNIHDKDFDKNVYKRDPCNNNVGSYIDIPAHSAPLGLVFILENSDWPEDYWYDLLVAYHGSWNKTTPTGYKIVRHKFDKNGNYQGVEDFITGWLTEEGKALGRPVDILIHNSSIYVSDDKAGVIYQVKYYGQK